MGKDSFYGERKEHSFVKSTIVAKYFWAWAKAIIPAARGNGIDRIAYIDLFSGPGYMGSDKSTPILVLERAIREKDIREMLVAIFNDINPDYAQLLEAAIRVIPDIDTLRYQPQVHNYQVGEEIAQMLERSVSIPTLLFVDPWGYKGLTLRLLHSVLRNWGSDCIFFFNFNRIRMGIYNDVVKHHMDDLFGEERADKLREDLKPLQPSEREVAIVEAISQALTQTVGGYVLPFKFRGESGTRTSHHLIFVTKHVLGYKLMKEIMAKESSGTQQGVASFEYNPATQRQPLLFELSRPLDDLGAMLLRDFAGRTLPMAEIFNQHHVGRPYIEANYKAVLAKLEADGMITTRPRANERPKRKGEVTFSDRVLVTFPSRS